jgi:quercetin dioxygenase-like cupin family protein/ribosome-binding protein aMBF1 (putative translation factor)
MRAALVQEQASWCDADMPGTFLEHCSSEFPMKKTQATPAPVRPQRPPTAVARGKPAAQTRRRPAVPSAQTAQTAQAAPAIGSRLRHARHVKGLLLKELAERVGVSISLISKYENDKVLPPLTVLHALVSALDTNIGALFEPSWSPGGYVARAGQRPRITAGGDGGHEGVTLERLVPDGHGHLLQANIHMVAPGGGSMGPMRHEGDEMGYVLEGRLELRIGDTVYEVAPGDSFSFPSTLAHAYRNLGPDVVRVLWVNTPPTF